MRCDECRFFRLASRHVNYTDTRADIPECRYNAPASSGWPSVLRDDWCAEFEAAEKPSAAGLTP